MEETIAFLDELRRNNNREWFGANRERYRAVRARFDGFTLRLIDAIAAFDPMVRGLTLRDCSFRIYRDTRFHPYREPYNTHLSAFVCPFGRNSGYAGYYFRVEPGATEPSKGHLLSIGMYRPGAAAMKSIRDEIFLNGDAFASAVAEAEAEGFRMQGEALRRMPVGYPADHPYAGWLRLKDIDLVHPADDAFMRDDGLLERLVAKFRSAYAITSLLNRCVAYARGV